MFLNVGPHVMLLSMLLSSGPGCVGKCKIPLQLREWLWKFYFNLLHYCDFVSWKMIVGGKNKVNVIATTSSPSSDKTKLVQLMSVLSPLSIRNH